MDEASANLDKNAELDMISNILKMDGLTVLAIIHNLELAKTFDKILLVENAKITEKELEMFLVGLADNT